MGNSSGANAAFENAARLVISETAASTPADLATRSFDFLARKNFQINKRIQTSVDRLVAKATDSAGITATADTTHYVQIDANHF
jgi:hypothetical protein